MRRSVLFILPLGLGTVSLALSFRVVWPDLTAVSNNNPHHILCTVAGTSSNGNVPGFDKAAEDTLKNRFQPPPAQATPIHVTDLSHLQVPNPSTARLPAVEGRFVAVDAWVVNVDYGGGGTGANGEACNCQSVDKQFIDTHITLAATPTGFQSNGKGTYVAEVTQRTRMLAKAGLLHAHDALAGDWSTPTLKHLIGAHCRIYGYLFYDNDHHTQAWDIDPTDTKGMRNWRQSCYEIHPVYGIEVLGNAPSPQSVRRRSTSHHMKAVRGPVEDSGD